MVTQQEILTKLDLLLPAIAARAGASDLAGQMSDETIREMTDAGLFATLTPKEYGGHELDLQTFSKIVQRVSAVHPSAGWVCSFLMGASWRLLTFGRDGQREIFGELGHVMGAGTAAPIFGIEKVDGGYLVSGRTAWNSGSSHADWIQMNGLLKTEAGPPSLIMFAIPRSEVEILDTWHIMGMKGTASRDVVVDKVFVPEHRAVPFAPALDGNSHGHRLHANQMYHIPFLPFAMVEVLPVVVGTHRGAANALRDRIKLRMSTMSGVKAAEKVSAQIRMAQGLARAEMAEQMLSAMIDKVGSGDADSTDPIRRAAIKLHAAMVTMFCLDSVNEMARSVGGDAFRDEAPFQRYFRDINTVARHAFLDPDTAAETYGKLELGLPVADPLI
jgi:3-hydroxy-9,10-secoandrosta-1,3,5(10)-triene-9,17-dione monooxygenase